MYLGRGPGQRVSRQASGRGLAPETGSASEHRRQLEDQGLVERRVLDSSPVAVEYRITPFGRTALDFLDELRRWSESLPPALAGRVVGER